MSADKFHRTLNAALVRSAAPAEGGLPSDNLRQFLDERPVILCRTCMRPLTWETRTEPGFLPRTGWYDDARVDALVCFKAADYRHVPLTDREWAYYEAGQRSVQVTDDGLAERVERLTKERDALAAAVDRMRRRHPRGDEESGYLAPGLWCPTCGHERTDNGYGGCPDRQALIIPGQPLRGAIAAPSADRDERDGA